jgi:hypothetical protein
MAQANKPYDAYILGGSGKQKILKALKVKNDCRAFVTLTSDDEGFGTLTFVDGDTESEVKDKAKRIKDKINPPTTDTSYSKSFGPLAPTKWMSKPAYRAYLRVTTSQPDQVMAEIKKSFASNKYPYGSAIVDGTYDILLELAEDSDKAVRDLVAQAKKISGIGTPKVGYAYEP